jgi:hypothetical protein
MPEKLEITAKLIDSLGHNGDGSRERYHLGTRAAHMADDSGGSGDFTIEYVVYRTIDFSLLIMDKRIEIPFREYVRMGRPCELRITGTGKYEPVRS